MSTDILPAGSFSVIRDDGRQEVVNRSGTRRDLWDACWRLALAKPDTAVLVAFTAPDGAVDVWLSADFDLFSAHSSLALALENCAPQLVFRPQALPPQGSLASVERPGHERLPAFPVRPNFDIQLDRTTVALVCLHALIVHGVPCTIPARMETAFEHADAFLARVKS